jgi:hypothetical protein
MVWTGNAALFDATITERSAPVCAPIVKQTDASLFVTEKDKCFAEDPNQLRWSLSCELASDTHGIPIAA